MFALVFNGLVAQIANETFPVNPTLNWVDLTNFNIWPEAGWIAIQEQSGWEFEPPAAYVPPGPTWVVAALAALSQAQITVNCAQEPNLSGTYGIAGPDISHIQSELISLLVQGTFADGSTTVEWLDSNGIPHPFSIAAFKAFAIATAGYVAAVSKAAENLVQSVPSNTIALSF